MIRNRNFLSGETNQLWVNSLKLIDQLKLTTVCVCLFFCSTSASSQSDNPLEYRVLNQLDDDYIYWSAKLDIPVFSGAFNGDNYAFTVGGKTEFRSEKFGLSASGVFNLSPRITAEDFENDWVFDNNDQLLKGSSMFSFMGTIPLKTERSVKELHIIIDSEKTGHNEITHRFFKADFPVIKTYSLRFGYSKFGAITHYKGIIDLPRTFSENNDIESYYTSSNVLNSADINGYGIRTGNPRKAIRIGFEIERLFAYEVEIVDDRIVTFSEGDKIKKRANAFKKYADLLIGLKGNSVDALPVILVNDEGRTNLDYNYIDNLKFLPVGAVIGLETNLFGDRLFQMTLFAEVGFVPGYLNKAISALHGTFGIRLGKGYIGY